ncbi:hypothetical protein BN341_2320 [Helicobacter heilmannii ASB1.4]|nr:hypothetical protein BN341_2320 [Helicobacter heilmannii ASB1.4]
MPFKIKPGGNAKPHHKHGRDLHPCLAPHPICAKHHALPHLISL